MLKIYKTDNQTICEKDQIEEGAWIELINPTMEECQKIAQTYDIDIADIRAALDNEESSRVESEEGCTLILVDIPLSKNGYSTATYITIPLGILLTQEAIITVCTKETPILQNFKEGKVKDFSTKKKMRFVYQMFLQTVSLYQNNLRIIDKNRTAIEGRVMGNTKDVDLIDLHGLESTLVYFATSLRANDAVLDRLSRYSWLKQYPQDQDLLGDAIVENRQAIEMALIYRDILKGTRELLSSIISDHMNNVMKYLTSITFVMAIPTVISGLYGMNVSDNWVPFAKTPYGFEIITLLILVICILTLFIFHKRKML